MRAKASHIPERTCVGCRRKGPKTDFLRIARNRSGEVAIDPHFRAPGRGAYLCLNEECVRKAKKRGALARALRTSVEDAFYEALLKYVRERSGPQS